MTTQENKQDKKSKDILGNLSLALGIIAIISCWIPAYAHPEITIALGFFLGIYGVTVSLINKRNISGRSLTGIVINIFALIGYPASSNSSLAPICNSKANLRGIGQSISLYEQTYQSRPDSLDELLKVGFSASLLRSPASDQQYEYINLPKDAPKELIWAYDPSPYGWEYYALLHKGDVKAYSKTDFYEVIKTTKKFMAEYSKEH